MCRLKLTHISECSLETTSYVQLWHLLLLELFPPFNVVQGNPFNTKYFWRIDLIIRKIQFVLKFFVKSSIRGATSQRQAIAPDFTQMNVPTLRVIVVYLVIYIFLLDQYGACIKNMSIRSSTQVQCCYHSQCIVDSRPVYL